MIKRYTSPSNEHRPTYQHIINSEYQNIISGSLVGSCSGNKKVTQYIVYEALHNDSLAFT